MKLQDAKKFYDHEDEQDLSCDTPDCDGTMVKWEGDKVCNKCGYMYDANPPEHFVERRSGSTSSLTDENDVREPDVLLAERRVVKFRNRDGSGWHGSDRVTFAGGFFDAWFDEDGSLDL
jgi:hypothetical protein